MSEYKEFTGKSVEEALRLAREEFGVELAELDFEILTPGSRGVLGMGAEPARIVAAPSSALGGAAPKREAAASQPLPPRPPREDRPRDDRGPRRDDRGPRRDDRGPRRDDRGPRRDERQPFAADRPAPTADRPSAERGAADRPLGADRGRPGRRRRRRCQQGRAGPRLALHDRRLYDCAPRQSGRGEARTPGHSARRLISVFTREARPY